MLANSAIRTLFTLISYVDPNFGGFKPLPDNHALPTEEILRSSHLYFQDATKMSQVFVVEIRQRFIGLQRDKDENRENMENGVWFIVGTILLDWLICTI